MVLRFRRFPLNSLLIFRTFTFLRIEVVEFPMYEGKDGKRQKETV